MLADSLILHLYVTLCNFTIKGWTNLYTMLPKEHTILLFILRAYPPTLQDHQDHLPNHAQFYIVAQYFWAFEDRSI